MIIRRDIITKRRNTKMFQEDWFSQIKFPYEIAGSG